MVSFLLPSIQKRLLRYALSRLELLDTDALDLENLDITWGKRSSIELRDVGLRLKVGSGDPRNGDTVLSCVLSETVRPFTTAAKLRARPSEYPGTSIDGACRHLQ